VVQFAITIGIITGTLVVFDQLSYFQNKKLGFDKEQIVVIKGVKYLNEQAPVFRDEIRKQSGVVNATVSSTVPGYFINHQVLLPDIRDKYEVGFVWGLFSDEYFADTYGLEMVSGTYLTGDPSRDESSVVINETTAQELEMDAPLERYLSIGGPPKNVIGVIRDFHYESLHSKIRPFSANHIGDNWSYHGRFISVRLHPADIAATLDAIGKQWQKFAPDEPFEYYFLDSNLEELYGAEQRTGKMFATFSVFAVLISCLGLFGLISYAAEQRTREIGIRKVLGATVPNIVVLLANEIARLLLAAVVIAGPLAYLWMNNWLENFSYRTDFNIGNFVVAAVVATIIALATVSFRAAKAAMANPAESLRYE